MSDEENALKMFHCRKGHTWLGKAGLSFTYWDMGERSFESPILCPECIFALLEQFFGGVESSEIAEQPAPKKE